MTEQHDAELVALAERATDEIMAQLTDAPPPPSAEPPPTEVFTPQAPARGKSRVTVVEQVYHQVTGEQPTVINTPPAWRDGDTDEQPWVREITIGGAWTALDLGWFKDNPAGVGTLVLRNKAAARNVIPTDAEAAEQASHVIEVAIAPPPPSIEGKRTMFAAPRAAEPTVFHAFAPGEPTLRVQPPDAGAVVVRCRAGVARLAIAALPR
jgi:hypothetical protein